MTNTKREFIPAVRILTVNIRAEDAEAIRNLVRQGYFISKSDAIRTMIYDAFHTDVRPKSQVNTRAPLGYKHKEIAVQLTLQTIDRLRFKYPGYTYSQVIRAAIEYGVENWVEDGKQFAGVQIIPKTSVDGWVKRARMEPIPPTDEIVN